MTIRHAWLQKHPSPSAAAGEFHWHPPDRDRELRTSCVERLRGIEPPAVLWSLAPGRVAWAQLFAATAPVDRRSYVGVVLTIVEDDGARPADLLAALIAPPAEPWQRDDAMAERAGALGESEAVAVARSLVSGGSAYVADPANARLAAELAALERLVPAATADRPREGACTTRKAARGNDPVAELLVAAARAPGSRADVAWQLLGELATARGRTLDDVAAEDPEDALHAALTDRERELAGTAGFVETLHGWGRGRLDASDAAATLPVRLADVLALRVLGHLVRGDDAGAAISEARWHALLPAARRTELFAAASARTGALRVLVEAHHA